MVPLRNVYYLLCYAWEAAELATQVDTGVLAAERMENLLAHLLVSGVGNLLRRGLDRAYVERSEDSRTPRGKLDFNETVKRHLERSGRVTCRYDELAHDVLHNQLLRATMLRLVSAGIDAGLAQELLSLTDRMREVRRIEPEPSLFRRVQLHRGNAHYWFLLHVCELAIRSLLPDPQGHGYRFEDFRRNEREMGLLFEQFVRGFLRREQSFFRVSRQDIPWQAEPLSAGAEAVMPLMKTDISLVAPGRRVLVETKFYTNPLATSRFGSRKLREAHLYQVFAYLWNLEERQPGSVDAAVLLYAAGNDRFDYRFRLGKHELQARSLDLAQSWEGIRTDLLALAGSLRQPSLRGTMGS